ncbi:MULTISPECIES: molybdenum cofactor guanylyltransferase MobA [Alphaproteobacteria]|uniref:Molybdenum cofactor guanylyltransferase n=2 Tax=Alphaproteobacteria TaxID=28211 RepID=A0A512HCD0_9HYPH|nr:MULTISPECIES: molybdenum cofactor guanylyltransferase MobA [Alphaproteobacteria]GEO83105.1 molybdenum cofactor guanylyltransferase [Ciceribacter naphthalenivorans]GLR20499.1 molybdenum cofactor guanylyltransferase [Ciceribacter naphthalenivorans]GLT03355.1 molybdenum cofactor guanylyltransferase [Sphingomonas psychrolutea]
MTGDGNPPGLILAGGLSRRMGRDKASALLAGRPMIDRIAERLRPQVSSLALNACEGFAGVRDLPLVPDLHMDRPGPLAGVLAGLRHAAALPDAPGHLLTVPADTPFLPTDLVLRLVGQADDRTRIVLASSAGQIHPVIALWPLSLADDLEGWMASSDNRRLQSYIARHPAIAIDFALVDTPAGTLDPFFNVNTPEDLATAERFIEVLSR